jgi:glycogen synthase
MASGLACVSCRSVSVVDCLRDGENGLLTEPGDVPALADALRRLLRNRASREHLARTALDECRQIDSWQAVARQIMGIYAAVARQGLDPAPLPDLSLSPCRFREQPHLL